MYTDGVINIRSMATLIDRCLDCLAYLEGHADVRTGTDGQLLPNDAMILAREMREVLGLSERSLK